jgi:glycosyltransferase involved in cell wall biosynthesis
MEKQLTLIIPTYNMEKYLRVCLDSLIIGEDQGNLEVLVINDGSKDTSSAIAHEYEEKYPETFRVIDKENGNYGSCINRGLKEATGRYVKILDADDYFENTALKSLMQKIPTINTDLILTDNTIFGDNNISKKYYGFELPTDSALDFANYCDKIKGCIQMHNVTYKRDIFSRFHYHQTEGISYTDMEWIFAPMARVQTFIYFPIPLYKYLIGREGQTISPEQIKRSIGHGLILTNSMLSMYDEAIKDADPGIHDYLYFRMLREVKSLYRSYLAEVPGLQLENLSEFDKRLKAEQPELYIDSACFTMGPFIRIHYVDYWRKHNYAPQPRLFYSLHNNYMKLLFWCKRLLGIHRV